MEILLCRALTADSEEMKVLAVSNAEAAFKSHQHRVSGLAATYLAVCLLLVLE